MLDDKTTPGATVRLKSGGPSMTVDRVVGRLLHVSWDDGAKRSSTTYVATCVELVRPAPRRA